MLQLLAIISPAILLIAICATLSIKAHMANKRELYHYRHAPMIDNAQLVLALRKKQLSNIE